ncbi:Gluconokinase [Halomicronema hongdechloris C2206]|uniref:Gluconokinase n=1 Tax=Halomicronema hongdechloris C2206 TaxID=1641165 RepID=A0A1Z3HLF5_9CYAN|nr:gluconokinase [Halomicronema hongdechloris]ASC70927.1 Gluconokinase [Halomicronema hongdechloris C2206]
MTSTTTIVIVMGIAGTGKTTLGKALARTLNWTFYEGDDLHPAANIVKMARGQPLTDADRVPWLQRLAQVINQCLAQQQSAVITCSALKAAYRKRLQQSPAVQFVYLTGSRALIQQRLQQRQDHFMTAQLLDSQLATLEEPDDALRLDIAQSLDAMVQQVCRWLEVDGQDCSS